MKTQEIIEKIKKNRQLTKSEKKELIDFWSDYVCPLDGGVMLEARYHDGEVKQYTVQDRLDKFYDEQPIFIYGFFETLKRGKPFGTRFAVYKILPVS